MKKIILIFLCIPSIIFPFPPINRIFNLTPEMPPVVEGCLEDRYCVEALHYFQFVAALSVAGVCVSNLHQKIERGRPLICLEPETYACAAAVPCGLNAWGCLPFTTPVIACLSCYTCIACTCAVRKQIQLNSNEALIVEL